MTSLANKTALITGSTSGIGQGIADRLAKAGANIMLNGMGDAAKIEAQRVGLEKNYGIRAAYHPADMTKPAEIADLVHQTVTTFGSIDILVNNAGIQFVSPVEDFPIEKWDAIIAIDLSSSFHTIRAATPYMKKQGWGRMIQISSIHGLVASPFKAAYVAAKHGVAGLTKTIGVELARTGITCNAICPGYVWTPLVAGQLADTAKARGMTEDEVKMNVLLAAQPTREFTTIEQVADCALFLCSPAADNMTGAMLSIDGGWSAQ